MNKKINPHETILEAEAMGFFTLENYGPSSDIFSMANWLRVNVLQRSFPCIQIITVTCTNICSLTVSFSFYPYILDWHGFLLFID